MNAKLPAPIPVLFPLARWIGYTMLLMLSFDLVAIFVPPGFTNASWELQVVVALADRVGVPLIAFAFIFWGKSTRRERPVLRIFSWASLVVAVAYFALIPLGLRATQRLTTDSDRAIAAQVTQQLNQLQQRRDQAIKLTPQMLDNAFNQLSKANKIEDITSPGQLKSRLFSELQKAEEQVKAQSDKSREETKTNILKNAARSCLTSLAAAAIFTLLWWGANQNLKKEDLEQEELEQSAIEASRESELPQVPRPTSRFVIQEDLEKEQEQNL